jgi:hypothetical protein
MLNTEFKATYQNETEQPLAYIASALKGLRYGSIEIVIHDSRIVQVERKEKLRFDRER